jgi:hypothetical protein
MRLEKLELIALWHVALPKKFDGKSALALNIRA